LAVGEAVKAAVAFAQRLANAGDDHGEKQHANVQQEAKKRKGEAESVAGKADTEGHRGKRQKKARS
jgi:hypothetical protein